MLFGVDNTIYSPTIRAIVKGADMTKIIILPEETLDRYYDRTLNYLHTKYHSQSSGFGSKGGDPNQAARDAEGRHLATQGMLKNIPIGKAVY